MSTTREQLISQISNLSTNTLERLVKVAETVLIPDEDLLVNATQQQMLQKAFELADTYFPEWTDRSSSDFGRFVIELLCLFSEKDFWYINAYMSESILSKMTVFSYAFARAVEMGYNPSVSKGAELLVNASFASGSEITYLPGQLAIKSADTLVLFTNKEAVVVGASLSVVNVPVLFVQGKLGNYSAPFEGSTVYLSTPNIDVFSIELKVNGVLWTRVPNWAESASSDLHYMAIPEEDGTVTLFFGDGVFGAVPSVGSSIEVNYRETLGASANGNYPGLFSIDSALVARPATSATCSPISISNGTSLASLSSIKAKAPKASFSRNGGNNIVTIKSNIDALTFVRKSSVVIFDTSIYIYAVPIEGEPSTPELESAFLSSIVSAIEFNVLGGYIIVPVRTNYVSLPKITVELSVGIGADTEPILEKAKQVIEDYTNPLVNAEYGRSFDPIALSKNLRYLVPGVVNAIVISPDDVSINSGSIMSRIDVNSTDSLEVSFYEI